MPLQFQNVEVPLGSSQDESQALFALPQPLLASLKNARVYKTGSVGKRPGWAAQANGLSGERVLAVGDDVFTLRQRTQGVISAAVGLGSLNNGAQRVDVHAGATGAYSLSEVEVLERRTISRDVTSGDGVGVMQSTGPDFAVNASTNIAVIAWETAVPAVFPTFTAQHVIFAQAIDVNTGQIVAGPQQISTASGSNVAPHVVQSDATTIVVVYSRPGSGEIRARAFDCSARTWGTDTVIASDLNLAQSKYDACEFSNGGTGWFLIYRNTTPTVAVKKLSGVGVTVSTTLGEDANAGLGAVACYADFNSNNAWFAWYDNTNGLRACIRQAAGLVTVVLANTTVEAATDAAYQIALATGPGSGMTLLWTTDSAVSLAGSGYGRRITKYRSLSVVGGLGTQVQWPNVELISKPCRANGYTYAAMLYDASCSNDATKPEGLRSSANQVAFTMMIVDAENPGTAFNSFRVAATWAIGEAGRSRLPSSLSAFRAVSVNGKTQQWFMLGVEFEEVDIGAEIKGRIGVDLCRQRLDAMCAIYAARIGNNVVFSGGTPQVWDGAALSEYGFLVPPENGKAVDTATGGALAVGAYGVQLVWEYRLATGDVVRSVPSLVLDATLNSAMAVAAANDRLVITAPTLSTTRKWDETSSGRAVLCRAYRTEANQSIYYYEGDLAHTLGFAGNVVAATPLALTVGQSDATAITHDKLYTTGAILPNFPPPALAYVHTHRNRVFGIVAENRRQIVFTHQYQAGELPGWHPDLVVDVPDECVALATLDEKLVILARNGIYMIAGNGPDRRGLNSDYDEPFRLNSPHGCVSAASVVSFPNGIAYLADTGFCAVDRQTTVTRIGGPVEDTLAAFPYVHASNVDEGREWIYWAAANGEHLSESTDGRTIVYDWRHNVWAVDQVGAPAEIPPGFSFAISFARASGQTYSTISADTHVYLESGSADPGPQWIYTYFRTGMLHLGSNQRFQRARWLTLLGERKGIGQIAATVTTFNNATPGGGGAAQFFTWADADLTTFSRYALKMHLANQTGQLFQVEVADGPDASFPTVFDDSASWTALLVEMGLKKSTIRNPQGAMK